MKNQFKKIIAIGMVVVTSMGCLQPAFAKSSSEERTYEFMGEEEVFLSSSEDYETETGTTGETSNPEVVTTYIEKDDGSYEIFTYKDGDLIEIVECRRGGDYLVVKDIVNGEIVSEETVYVEVEEEEHIQIAPRAYSPIGKMSYYNPHMDTTLSITVARDDSTKDKTITITDGKYTIAKIAGILVSTWFLPLVAAKSIVLIIFGSLVIDEIVTIVGTKEVTGRVTQYTWRGIPSDTNKGSIGYLDGLTVVYKDKNNNTKTHKEDFQPSAWKTDTFGRMMFYEVYKLDVNPTSWK